MSNLDFLYEGETVTANCDRNGSDLIATVGDKQFTFTPIGDNLYSTMLNGRRCVVGAIMERGICFLDIDSVLLEVKEPSEDGVAGGAGGLVGEKDKIYAPMPGKIVKIQVAVGDAVTEKQPMVIVEAMKMENQVISQAVGTVKAVNFSEGDQVDTESPIIELELEPEE